MVKAAKSVSGSRKQRGVDVFGNPKCAHIYASDSPRTVGYFVRPPRSMAGPEQDRYFALKKHGRAESIQQGQGVAETELTHRIAQQVRGRRGASATAS